MDTSNRLLQFFYGIKKIVLSLPISPLIFSDFLSILGLPLVFMYTRRIDLLTKFDTILLYFETI